MDIDQPSTSTLSQSPVTPAAQPSTMFKLGINCQERYMTWGMPQPSQNDLTFLSDEHNVKRVIRIADLETWFVSLYARPPNVVPTPTFVPPGNLGSALADQTTPNFRGYTIIGVDTESVPTKDIPLYQASMPLPHAKNTAAVPRYIQLGYPSGRMLVFETFMATADDWTAFFAHIDGDHTIVVTYDGTADWAGIYALIGTQFRTARQKKDKDVIIKAIHYDLYRLIQNIENSPPLFKRSKLIGFVPERRTLKGVICSIWGFDVTRLTQVFPSTIEEIGRIDRHVLPDDVLMYAGLDAYYPVLLFLAFGRYGFIPKLYDLAQTFPHDSLYPEFIDNMAQTLTAKSDNADLPEDYCGLTGRGNPTLSTICLPAILRDEVLAAYKFFTCEYELTDHGRRFCLFKEINGYNSLDRANRSIYPAVIKPTKIKVKKTKRPKTNEMTLSPTVSDDDDPTLQPTPVYDDAVRLQELVGEALLAGKTGTLEKVIGVPIAPIYILDVRDELLNPRQEPLPPYVTKPYQDRMAFDQPLRRDHYALDHYGYEPDVITRHLEGDISWMNHATAILPLTALIASPCSMAEFRSVNNSILTHAQNLPANIREQIRNFLWLDDHNKPTFELREWMNRIPRTEPSHDDDAPIYPRNRFALRPIIVRANQMVIGENNNLCSDDDYDFNPHGYFHMYSRLLANLDHQNLISFPALEYHYRLPEEIHNMSDRELENEIAGLPPQDDTVGTEEPTLQSVPTFTVDAVALTPLTLADLRAALPPAEPEMDTNPPFDPNEGLELPYAAIETVDNSEADQLMVIDMTSVPTATSDATVQPTDLSHPTPPIPTPQQHHLMCALLGAAGFPLPLPGTQPSYDQWRSFPPMLHDALFAILTPTPAESTIPLVRQTQQPTAQSALLPIAPPAVQIASVTVPSAPLPTAPPKPLPRRSVAKPIPVTATKVTPTKQVAAQSTPLPIASLPPTAPVVAAQSATLPIVTQLPTAPIPTMIITRSAQPPTATHQSDSRVSQTPTTSRHDPKYDAKGRPIQTPGRYEHSLKRKEQRQDEVASRKAHSSHPTDDKTTSSTSRGKTSAERTAKRKAQRDRKRERNERTPPTTTTTITTPTVTTSTASSTPTTPSSATIQKRQKTQTPPQAAVQQPPAVQQVAKPTPQPAVQQTPPAKAIPTATTTNNSTMPPPKSIPPRRSRTQSQDTGRSDRNTDRTSDHRESESRASRQRRDEDRHRQLDRRTESLDRGNRDRQDRYHDSRRRSGGQRSRDPELEYESPLRRGEVAKKRRDAAIASTQPSVPPMDVVVPPPTITRPTMTARRTHATPSTTASTVTTTVTSSTQGPVSTATLTTTADGSTSVTSTATTVTTTDPPVGILITTTAPTVSSATSAATTVSGVPMHFQTTLPSSFMDVSSFATTTPLQPAVFSSAVAADLRTAATPAATRQQSPPLYLAEYAKALQSIRTTEPPRSEPNFLARERKRVIDMSKERFAPRTLEEMAIIRFFNRQRINISQAVINRANNASLALFQFFHDLYHLDEVRTGYTAIPLEFTRTVLLWLPTWVRDFGCVDGVVIAQLVVFLFESRGVNDNRGYSLAYEYSIEVVDRWLRTTNDPNHPTPDLIPDIRRIFNAYHTAISALPPILRQFDMPRPEQLPPMPLPTTGVPMDYPQNAALPPPPRPRPMAIDDRSSVLQPRTTYSQPSRTNYSRRGQQQRPSFSARYDRSRRSPYARRDGNNQQRDRPDRNRRHNDRCDDRRTPRDHRPPTPPK